jgi:hypothetical protein
VRYPRAFGRDNIGITRLSVFFSRRSFLISTRRFLAALVRGRPFMAFSSEIEHSLGERGFTRAASRSLTHCYLTDY